MVIQTKEEIIALPGQDITLEVVADPESLIGDQDAIADIDTVPCWAWVWPAARALAAYLWNMPELQGWQAIDLGCGIGLAGVVAGVKGAEVTFSDYNADALHLAGRNARRNGVAKYRLHRGDWRNFEADRHYDLVIASDILYEQRLIEPLLGVFQQVLVPGGLLLVAHPGRDLCYQAVNRLKEAGWFEEQREERVITVEEQYRSYHYIVVQALRRPGA